MAQEEAQIAQTDAPAEPTAEEKAQENTTSKRGPSGKAQLGNIQIDPAKPLPNLNVGQVKAYDAVGTGSSAGNYFALVCEHHLTPRLRAMPIYKNIINPSALTLVSNGTVFWPPSGKEHYVLIYQSNISVPIVKPNAVQAMDWKQDLVIERVIRPMVGLLMDFRDKDFVHGGIRASNMYASGGDSSSRIILGDCLSAPASSAQAVLYETIERGMADAAARGKGTQSDDLYSFGVMLAVLLRGKDPMQGMSDEEILKEKIEMGSYAAVTGRDRFTGSILELLRGLLNDDPQQRWNLDEITAWLDGRRLSPKQSTRQKKAARPLVIGENRYFLTSMAALDFEHHADEAVLVIEDGRLEQWLVRSVEDKDMVEKLEQVVMNARELGRGPGYQERLLSNVSFVLDPVAPMRFRGLHLMGDGVGTALTECMVLKKDPVVFHDLFNQGIALNWAMIQSNPFMDIGTLISRFDACRSFVRQNKIGYGLERCIYFLNPEAHCMSDKLKDYYVTSPEKMLAAFEDLCTKDKAPALFLDRHSVAYLSVHDRKTVDGYLYELNSDEDHKKILGNLKCLATIQKLSSLPSFPAIAKVFTEMLPIVYQRYHDNNIREKLKVNVERFASKGDLVKMAGLLDNAEINEKDFAAFRKAMQEYSALRKEYRKFEAKMMDKKTFGKHMGQDISAVVSSVFASIIILAMVFLYFTNQSFF